jgi:peptidoglycan/LPS O-acetylase OafA/YrhL
MWESYFSGPNPGVPVDVSFATFIANLAFLQTIVVPVFGSNGPLWSLANEFWYYVAFPLAYIFFRAKADWIVKAAYVTLLVGIAALVGFDIVKLWPIWLMGYGLHWAEKKISFHGSLPICLFLLGASAFVIFAFRAERAESLIGDYTIGLACCVSLLALRHRLFSAPMFRYVAAFGARISYSLYLCHFPLLAFLAAVLLKNRQADRFIDGLSMFVLFICAALILAAAISWLFERNTALVRLAVERATSSKRKT